MGEGDDLRVGGWWRALGWVGEGEGFWVSV